MLKLKYYSLKKEDKEKLKNRFYATDFGNNLNARLKRLLIIGILGILFSLYLLIAHVTIWDITTGCLLLIASIVFIYASFKIRIKKLNEFLVKDNKKK